MVIGPYESRGVDTIQARYDGMDMFVGPSRMSDDSLQFCSKDTEEWRIIEFVCI